MFSSFTLVYFSIAITWPFIGIKSKDDGHKVGNLIFKLFTTWASNVASNVVSKVVSNVQTIHNTPPWMSM